MSLLLPHDGSTHKDWIFLSSIHPLGGCVSDFCELPTQFDFDSVISTLNASEETIAIYRFTQFEGDLVIIPSDVFYATKPRSIVSININYYH